MPNISERGVEMPASPIRKLAPLADAAKQRGVHVYHLNIGSARPSHSASGTRCESAMSIVRCWNIALVRDIAVISEKLVGYYKKYDINLTAHDVVVPLPVVRRLFCLPS